LQHFENLIKNTGYAKTPRETLQHITPAFTTKFIKFVTFETAYAEQKKRKAKFVANAQITLQHLVCALTMKHKWVRYNFNMRMQHKKIHQKLDVLSSMSG
jgi:hypothetical protein